MPALQKFDLSALTTFAASTEQTQANPSSRGLASNVRVNALILTVESKLTSASATMTINTPAERADLISAVVGNVALESGALGQIIDNVSLVNLIKIGYMAGAVPVTNLPRLGVARTCGVSGEYIFRARIRVPFLQRGYAIGASFAPFGGFFNSGGLRYTTGDGSASLGGVTWTVSTSASDIALSWAFETQTGVQPVARPCVQYATRTFASLDQNDLETGLYLGIANLTDQESALAWGQDASTGVDLKGNNGTLVDLSGYDPHAAMDQFLAQLPDRGARLRKFYDNEAQQTAAPVDASGIGAEAFVPIYAHGAGQALDRAYAGPLAIRWGSAYTASHDVGVLRVVRSSKSLGRGVGACACLCDGTPVVANAPSTISPYVGLA